MCFFFICFPHKWQIIFVNSLDLNQARSTVGPDLNPNCLIPDGYPERVFLFIFS